MQRPAPCWPATFSPAFALKHALKDADLAAQAAQASGTELTLTSALLPRWRRAAAAARRRRPGPPSTPHRDSPEHRKHAALIRAERVHAASCWAVTTPRSGQTRGGVPGKRGKDAVVDPAEREGLDQHLITSPAPASTWHVDMTRLGVGVVTEPAVCVRSTGPAARSRGTARLPGESRCGSGAAGRRDDRTAPGAIIADCKPETEAGKAVSRAAARLRGRRGIRAGGFR